MNHAFRYIVSKGSIESRVIPGKLKFIAQFNEKRGKMRRKPYLMNSLQMPFDENTFNFTKVKNEEILFQIECSDSSERATIIINCSPIEFGNALMVPRLIDCLPQILTKDSLKLAICLICLSGNKSFRLGFNSLGAAASVNHQHWHLYYFDFELQLECIQCENGFLKDWPLPAFVFELKELKLPNINKIVDNVFKYIYHCFEINMAHNLFITRSRNGDVIRIFLWLRLPEFCLKDDMSINPAFCEFSGFFICKTKVMFEEITEEQCELLMKSVKIADKTNFPMFLSI
ncbi:GDP-D-glucose phosphorylase 1-like protein [Dinothrombium tinctorium]|uniref:GDP-D-glucose phosphorylase 1 n=1 Tax=Dinothrombium tinctorium TaxID=1965070 RepID=A0A3S3SNX5_9ACAR|nr:GDP-D-glucose phosphorylase 1-like protein [Dinothrombium tinctorium]